MKKILFATVLTLFFIACSKEDDNGGISSEVAANLKQGNWRVSSFVDDGVNETAGFNGFNFTFNNGGTVNATNNVLTVNGSWSTGIDNSKHKLMLDFTTSSLSYFSEISEDWEIMAQSSTQISLRHISGGSGETDLLVFTKN